MSYWYIFISPYLITPSGLTSDYYAFTYEPGTLTVQPKTLTAGDFTVNVTTVEDDKLTAVYTGAFDSKDAAASVSATCSITGVTGSKADSYVLSPTTIEKTARTKISPMPITFTFGTTTYLYDGQQKAVTVSAVDSKNRVFSDFTVKYGDKTTPPSDVGTYPVTAGLTDTTNYTVKGSKTVTLTITEGNVIVWASGATSWKYDSTPKAITPMSVPTVNTTVTYYKITSEGKAGDVVDEPTDKGK